MRAHSQFCTLAGDSYFKEHRFLGIWFYWRHTSQKWSSMMTEIKNEYGFRFGAIHFGISRIFCQFHDGKEPTIVAGAH